MVGCWPAKNLARSLLRCHISFGDLGASASGRQVVVNEGVLWFNNRRLASSLFGLRSIDDYFNGVLFFNGGGVERALASFYKAGFALPSLGIAPTRSSPRITLSAN